MFDSAAIRVKVYTTCLYKCISKKYKYRDCSMLFKQTFNIFYFTILVLQNYGLQQKNYPRILEYFTVTVWAIMIKKCKKHFTLCVMKIKYMKVLLCSSF